MITYADMITLLLAVFIVLYSFSVLDLKKFEAVAGALGQQFGSASGGSGMLGGGNSILSGSRGIVGNRAGLINTIRDSIGNQLPDRLQDNLTVSHRAGVVTVSMHTDEIVFPVGEAKLTDEVRQILDVLGPSLRESMAPLLIEGHTCDLPIDTARFPSNWELSAQRATNVMVYLIRSCGIRPDHISAVGYADTQPLKPNTTDAGRRRNRRVDIVMFSGVPASSGALPHEAGVDAAEQTATRAPDPVRLAPPVDLRRRYFQNTGRRTVDTPTTHE